MRAITVSLQEAAVRLKAERTLARAKRIPTAEEIRRAVDAGLALADEPVVSHTLLEAGTLAFGAGDLQAALDYSEEARKMCVRLADTECAAFAANNGGTAARRLGLYELAVARLAEGATHWRDSADARRQAIALSNLGLTFRQAGDYTSALRTLNDAADLARNNFEQFMQVQNNLGLCYLFMGEFDRAGSYFNKLLQSRRAATTPGLSRILPRVKANLARTYLGLGHPAQAAEILEQATTEAHAAGDKVGEAAALSFLGQAWLQLGRISDAGRTLRQALELSRFAGDRPTEARSLFGLGLLLNRPPQPRPGEAKPILEQAVQVSLSSAATDEAIDPLLELARTEEDMGLFQQAEAHANEALKLVESLRARTPGDALSATWFSRRRSVIEFLVDTAVRRREPSASLAVAEQGRARALLDTLARGDFAVVPADLRAERESIQRQISFLAGVGANGRDARLEQLRARNDAVESRIHALWFGDSTAPAPAALTPVDLGAAALIEFHIGEHFSYRWTSQDGHARLTHLGPSAKIEQTARRFASLFNNIAGRRREPRVQQEFDAVRRLLSSLLFSDFGDFAPGLPIVLIPDGALSAVAFAALQPPGHSRPLGLEFDLLQAPSAEVLRLSSSPRSPEDFPRSVLALADPVFSRDDPRLHLSSTSRPAPGAASSSPDDRLPRLPFNGDITEITRLFPGRSTVLRGFSSTPDQFRSSEPSRYAVLHLSTHAVIDERTPDFSRVILTRWAPDGRPVPGILRAFDFAQLHLAGSLVVLSSCETALGRALPGEGLVGLTAGLLRAGASQLVLSTAVVDAEASSELFAAFYRNLAAQRAPGAEHPLTLARRELAASVRWNDPYFWASFQVVGRPGAR